MILPRFGVHIVVLSAIEKEAEEQIALAAPPRYRPLARF
jgi:hypothetical protein